MQQTSTMALNPGEISPTLTNPEMILPYDDFELPQTSFRTDSLGEDWRNIGSAYSDGSSRAQVVATTTPIIYGNGTMLSDIGEVTEAENPPGRKIPGPAERRLLKQAQQHYNNNSPPIRSSPTIGYEAVMKRAKTGNHQRKISIESTSTVRSEGQSAEIFKDFDDGVSVDDSVFQGDDEESVADSYTEGVIASETQRLSKNGNGLNRDEDRNASAALSRRAEEILLNAKKRLNNMEGNLTRARGSLFVPPIHSSSPLSRATPSPPGNVSRGPTLKLPIPRRNSQLHTPNDSPITSPGHNRVQSENSIASPLRIAPFPIRFPVRAASAAGRYNGRGFVESCEPSPPLSNNPESPREDVRNGVRSGISSAQNRTSPPYGTTLEPLNEDETMPDFEVSRTSFGTSRDNSSSPSGEHRGLTRSTSSMQMRDLRDQMFDLKGRLSLLRDRARDDTMKRRSLQSLRTPSPFTAAEQWYASSNNYGDSPLSANEGVAQAPWKEQDREEAESQSRHINGVQSKEHPAYADSEVTSIYEDVAETQDTSAEDIINKCTDEEEEEDDQGEFDTATEDSEHGSEESHGDEVVDRGEADKYESDASMYHDTVAVPISHEDREDAFDYEHFFLHSAMGTISQQRLARRGSSASFSSEGSVETTRGPAVASEQHESSKTGNKGASYPHMRSESTDTVSTMATFATAEEAFGSDNDDDEDHDNFAFQVAQAPLLQVEQVSKRSTFGGIPELDEDTAVSDTCCSSSSTPTIYNERNGTAAHRPSISSDGSADSTGTSRSFPLVNRPKSHSYSNPTVSSRNSISSMLGDSASIRTGRSDGKSPVGMLQKEDQILVERLVTSLGKCVLGLQEAGRSSYDGRVWRRRLDAARRVLEGQEGAV